MSRGDLPLRVTRDGGRVNATRTPQARESDHRREEGRLDHLDAIQGRGALDAKQGIAHRPLDVGRKLFLALAQMAIEHRRAASQTSRHAKPLGTLTGEEEHCSLRAGRGSPSQIGGIVAADNGRQAGQELLALGPQDDRAVIEGAAGGEEREGDVSWLKLGMCLDVRGEPPRRLAQRSIRLGREGKGDRC
jgi:hypothetical protein